MWALDSIKDHFHTSVLLVIIHTLHTIQVLPLLHAYCLLCRAYYIQHTAQKIEFILENRVHDSSEVNYLSSTISDYTRYENKLFDFCQISDWKDMAMQYYLIYFHTQALPTPCILFSIITVLSYFNIYQNP